MTSVYVVGEHCINTIWAETLKYANKPAFIGAYSEDLARQSISRESEQCFQEQLSCRHEPD